MSSKPSTEPTPAPVFTHPSPVAIGRTTVTEEIDASNDTPSENSITLDSNVDVKCDIKFDPLELEGIAFGEGARIRLEAANYYNIPQDDRIKDVTIGGEHHVQFTIKLESIKCNCPAKFLATETLMDIKEKAMVIDLHYQHVHPLASLEDIGTCQKSDRIKATIKSLLLQGSSIKHVMERLSIKHQGG
ncbi:hypothetical protein FBU30_008381 [Linnemannia zychae]|nr:hypothetical protein FBU30_008381 [Linnemannia zychae]